MIIDKLDEFEKLCFNCKLPECIYSVGKYNRVCEYENAKRKRRNEKDKAGHTSNKKREQRSEISNAAIYIPQS